MGVVNQGLSAQPGHQVDGQKGIEVIGHQEVDFRKEQEKEKLTDEYDKAGRKNDVGLLMDIQEKIDALEQQESDKMDEWEKINLELEGIEGEQL